MISHIILTKFHRLRSPCRSIQFTAQKYWQTGLIFVLSVLSGFVLAADAGEVEKPAENQLHDFSLAWQAATRGRRKEFERLMPGLEGYLLYPYLQYENYRYRRASVDPDEMAQFLESHRDWAFAAGLKKAWLRALGRRGRWDSLIRYANDSTDTEVQCYLAQARIHRQQVVGLEGVAKALWTVGKSQPEACDPVFVWLKGKGGITPGLAWERISRAMEAREPRLTLYLARYLERMGYPVVVVSEVGKRLAVLGYPYCKLLNTQIRIALDLAGRLLLGLRGLVVVFH